MVDPDPDGYGGTDGSRTSHHACHRVAAATCGRRRLRDILGGDFIDSEFVWSARAHLEGERPNIAALSAKAESLAESHALRR